MQRWALISGTGIVVCIGLLAWREWGHAREREDWAGQVAGFTGELEDCRAIGQAVRERAETAETTLAGLEIEHQTLRDRVTNLEAQRDHLRAENERQAGRVREIEQARNSVEEELEAARRRLLEQSVLPRELESQLEQARIRITGLEEMLDEQARSQSAWPGVLALNGVSGDGTVFTLSGELADADSLPYPVYVCRRNSILLEGWLNRVDEGLAVGHVENWREPSSTLVKGEKVFILPRSRHEADP